MILLDEDEQQQSKLPLFTAGPTLRLPERVAERNPPLPDYETSQALALQHVSPKGGTRNRLDSRFWRATMYAMIIYVFVSIGVTVALVVRILSLRRHHRPPPPSRLLHYTEGSSNSTSSQFPLNLGVVLATSNATCNTWQTLDDRPEDANYFASLDYSFHATGAFTIRSNVSDDRTNVQPVYGNMSVDINPDKTETQARVHVDLQTVSLQLRQAVHVPSNVPQPGSITFDIRVLYPQTPSPLHVDKLITYLPMFGQTFGDLDQKIRFSNIRLEGPTSDVHIQSVQARKILVKNSNAQISGNFNTSRSIILDTIGAPIDANITLVRKSSEKGPTFLTLDTGNSPLRAKVTLVAPAAHSLIPLSRSPPIFDMHMKTFNAPLTVDVSHDPSTPPTVLLMYTMNNLANSNVTLDSKFQGTFDVQTKLSSAVIHEGAASVGMFGETRKCVYDHQGSDSLMGWVGWGERPQPWKGPRQGHVGVVSSLSPVYLQLGP
ncbi:hypothetical protein PLICRDRAFT_103490 [Plicaturopsis crispa FD-325 SS-3]|nr:hypothetical protein PLICRDRAFT_103490 [Plicaturopsis crispa FD-325 SS-3]